MIRVNSRYAPESVQYILDSRTASTRPTVMRSARVIANPRLTQKWRDGQRLDMLGDRYYRSPLNWWQVMDRNPDVIDPLAFTPGERIVLQ